MTKAAFNAPGMGIAEAEAAVATAVGYDASNAAERDKIDQALTAVGLAVCSWEGRPWWWQRDTMHFQTSKLTLDTTGDAGVSRASNVVTADLLSTATHGLQVGQYVKIGGVDADGFDGTFKVATCPDTLTFTYGQVGDDETSEDGYVYVMSYPLRAIDITGAVVTSGYLAQAAWAVERMYYDDDWQLRPVSWQEMRSKMRLLQTTSQSKPFLYCITQDEPQVFLWPAPDAAYDIYADLIKRHSKISYGLSTNAALIIPPEFQWGLYVNGASWLIVHEAADPQALTKCPGFMEAIDRMKAAQPDQYDNAHSSNLFADARPGKYPHDRRVWVDGDQVLIANAVSIEGVDP